MAGGEWTCAVTQCTHPAFWLPATSPPLYIQIHTEKLTSLWLCWINSSSCYRLNTNSAYFLFSYLFTLTARHFQWAPPPLQTLTALVLKTWNRSILWTSQYSRHSRSGEHIKVSEFSVSLFLKWKCVTTLDIQHQYPPHQPLAAQLKLELKNAACIDSSESM